MNIFRSIIVLGISILLNEKSNAEIIRFYDLEQIGNWVIQRHVDPPTGEVNCRARMIIPNKFTPRPRLLKNGGVRVIFQPTNKARLYRIYTKTDELIEFIETHQNYVDLDKKVLNKSSTILLETYINNKKNIYNFYRENIFEAYQALEKCKKGLLYL